MSLLEKFPLQSTLCMVNLRPIRMGVKVNPWNKVCSSYSLDVTIKENLHGQQMANTPMKVPSKRPVE